MTYEQILKDLKNKVYHPVYFLMGEEPYFIDEISGFIAENVLDATEKGFNQVILYGRDTNMGTVLSQAKHYPMMSNYQVVIVREAQSMDMNDSDRERLESYIIKPLKSTILVFCYKYKVLDARTRLSMALKKHAVVFETKKLYENKVHEWVERYVSFRGYSIDPEAQMLLTEFLGTDLGKIANEMGKLLLNLPEGSRINAGHIEQYIGISKDYSVFELQNALGKRDILKANRIVSYFAANPKNNPLVYVIISLYGFFTRVLAYHFIRDKSRNNVAAALKINPFFVKDYQTAARNYPAERITRVVACLHEYDLRSKGIQNASAPEGELLRELVYRILH